MPGLAEIDILMTLKAAATSALAATLAAFALILLLVRLRVPLSLAIFGGAVALAALFGRPPGEIGSMALAGVTRPQTIGLVLVVVLMVTLSEAMRRCGQLDEIVAVAKAFLRRPAVTMAALPALIGLMPMPGGAQLSAPMVESAAGGAEVSRDRLSAINYWFRHIWEHWWPLYPGVMVAVSVTHSDAGAFILHQFPLGISMALCGLLLFRGAHPQVRRAAPVSGGRHVGRLLRATSTIWIILLVWGAVRAGFVAAFGHREDHAVLAAAGKYGPLALGLIVSLVWTICLHRMSARQAAAVLRRSSIYTLAAAVIAVMVFWQSIQHVEAAGLIARELADLHVPVAIVVAVLPLIAGLTTGLAVGFVGTSFPIVVAMVAAMPDGSSVRPYVALAYAFGHLGQMLSPLHICQIVSNEYFQASSRAVYRLILPSAGAMAAVAVAYFLLLRLITG